MPTEEAIDLKKKKKGEIYGAGHYLKIEFDHKMLSFKKIKNLDFELKRPRVYPTESQNQNNQNLLIGDIQSQNPRANEELKIEEEFKEPELAHSDGAAAASQPNVYVAPDIDTANTADNVAPPSS